MNAALGAHVACTDVVRDALIAIAMQTSSNCLGVAEQIVADCAPEHFFERLNGNQFVSLVLGGLPWLCNHLEEVKSVVAVIDDLFACFAHKFDRLIMRVHLINFN